MADAINPQEIASLLEYGNPTDSQREKLEAFLEHGSQQAAANALECNRNAVSQAIHQCRRKASLQGWSPQHDMTHTVPVTHLVKGVSTFYGDDGAVRAQWVKSNLKQEDKEKQIRAFVAELCDEVRGKAKKLKAPKIDTKALRPIIPIGDPHLGMYAWGEESGEDFDTDIAIRDIHQGVSTLIDAGPATEECVILNLGDFFHADDNAGITKRSGNTLDVDTRHSRVMRMGANLMVDCIDLALAKHKRVVVRNNIGNHDDLSSLALGLILEAYYTKEPRVRVDTSPNYFWYYRFGHNLIGSTHGHSVRPQDLPAIMANDRPQDWGETKHRHWYLGHFHKQMTHEIAGVLIEYKRTLAAKEAYANEAGYRSGRDIQMNVFHEEHGEVNRHIANIVRIR